MVVKPSLNGGAGMLKMNRSYYLSRKIDDGCAYCKQEIQVNKGDTIRTNYQDIPTCKEGGRIDILVSNLPSRVNASSSVSGSLVAAITITPLLCSNPGVDWVGYITCFVTCYVASCHMLC